MEVTEKNIEEVIRNTISKLSGIKPKEINPDAHFVKDLGIDSINVVELTVALEKNFGMTIDDLAMVHMTTINSTVKTVLGMVKK
jgi:acyl carrier protein